MTRTTVYVIGVLIFNAGWVHAAEKLAVKVPTCDRESYGPVVGTAEIIKYNKFGLDDLSAEALIEGQFAGFVPNNDNLIFRLKLGPGKTDKVTVVYSQFAKKLPRLKNGDKLFVCGRYYRKDDGGVMKNVYEDTAAFPGHGDGFVFAHGEKFE